MKSKVKQIVAWLLAIAMVVTLQPMQAFAAGDDDEEVIGGVAWEDPDYTNILGTEVFPNTSLEDWDKTVNSREAETRLKGGVKKVYISYNPGTAVADPTDNLILGRDADKTEKYNGIAERKYIEVFTPKLRVPAEVTGADEMFLTPTKITGINYVVSKNGSNIGESYKVFEANTDSDIAVTNKEAGLRTSFALNEPGDYVVELSFYAYFGELGQPIVADSDLYKWYLCSYTYNFQIDYGYRLNLYDYYANAATMTVDIESSNKTYDWDLSSYTPEMREGYHFLGWSTTQNVKEDIIEVKRSRFESRVSEENPFVVGNNARTATDVYAIFEKMVDKPHPLNYNLMGGKWKDNEPMVTNVDSYLDTVEIPITDFKCEREGYTFKGWTTDETSTEATLFAGDVLNVDTNGVTLYAVWEFNIEAESHYFINIWGITEEGKEYEFEGPTKENKVTLTIPVRDVQTDAYWATYTFDSSQMNKWFGAYGCDYYTMTYKSGADHQNGYHKMRDSWDISWPVEGGDVDIVYNLTGYDFTTNWYNSRSDVRPAKTDTIYSAKPITSVEMNPPTPPTIAGMRFIGWNETGSEGDPLVEEIIVGGIYNISLYPVYTPIESTYIVTHRYYIVDNDGNKTYEGEVTDEPQTGRVGQILSITSTDPLDIAITPKFRATYEDGTHNYSVIKSPENIISLIEDEQVEYEIEYGRSKCVGSVTFKTVFNVKDKEGELLLTYRSSSNPTVDYEEGSVVAIDKATGKFKLNGEIENDKPGFDLSGSYKNKSFTYTVAETSDDVTIEHSKNYEYTVTLEYVYDEAGGSIEPDDPDTPDDPDDGDAKYFINIWGVVEDGQDFEFEGPDAEHKVTIPISDGKVTTDRNWATYTFDSKIMNQYFGKYGVDYSTTTVGSGASHQNGYHAPNAVWDLSWPVDGGSIDIIYTFTGYAFTVKYYANRGEFRTLQEDATYSATPIEKVTLTPPAAPEIAGKEFVGWNMTGDANDTLLTEVVTGNAYEISLYPAYVPLKTTYVVKHQYYIIDKDGKKVKMEGEVVDDPKEGNVGQKLVYNGTDPQEVIIRPSVTAEYEDGSHSYGVIGVPGGTIVLEEGKETEYVIEYGRERCVGSVTFKVTCQVVDKNGTVLNSYLADAKPRFEYVEGTVVSIDKETASFMIDGEIDKDKNPLSLDGTYLDREFKYEVGETTGDLIIEHTKEYDYNITLTYNYDKDTPEQTTTKVRVHHEYYVDNSGTLLKEYEYDEDFEDVEIDTLINKAFHDEKHNPADACKATVNGIIRSYTEYERSADVKANKDGSTVYTVKYKRVPGVKYIIKHEYYINNEGGTYVNETTITEEGEAVPGTHISILSNDPNCIIASPKLTIELNGKSYTYEYASSDPEKIIAADGSTVFSIRYERKWTPNEGGINTTYTLNHEYYIVDSSGNKTKEGVFTETGTAPAGSKIGIASDGTSGFVVVGQKPTYTLNGMTYTYEKFGEDPITTIANNGTTIFTIKYMRQSGGDATRLGKYIVNHDLYKKDANGNWALERRITEEAKFAAVGSVVGVKNDTNGVTVDIPKMTFREIDGKLTKEYQFQNASQPVTLTADGQQEITLSYYYTEYEAIQPTNDTGSGNNVSPAPTMTPAPETNEAPKTGDNFKVSAMMPLSGLVSLICIGGLLKGKKKEEE